MMLAGNLAASPQQDNENTLLVYALVLQQLKHSFMLAKTLGDLENIAKLNARNNRVIERQIEEMNREIQY